MVAGCNPHTSSSNPRKYPDVGRNLDADRTTIRIWILYQSLVPSYKFFKMARNTSILLGEYFEAFISSEVSSGKYSSASEVVRTALRLLELEESKKKNLSKALQQGERSGFVKNFDSKTNLKKLHGKIQ